LGGVLGWAAGVWLVPQLLSTSFISLFFVLLAMLAVLCVVLVFSEKDFDQLFPTALSSKLILDDFAYQSLVSAGQYDVGNEPGSSSYAEACRTIAATFSLTEREQDIFDLLARGRGSDHIADRLHISLNTVRSHTQNIYVKTGVHSRNELMEMVESTQQDSGTAEYS
jgi:DNA-binding CsgD family transcriptional regulator